MVVGNLNCKRLYLVWGSKSVIAVRVPFSLIVGDYLVIFAFSRNFSYFLLFTCVINRAELEVLYVLGQSKVL